MCNVYHSLLLVFHEIIYGFSLSNFLLLIRFRFIRCWDVKLAREIYRITAGHGGLAGANDLCIWTLLALRLELVQIAHLYVCLRVWYHAC